MARFIFIFIFLCNLQAMSLESALKQLRNYPLAKNKQLLENLSSLSKEKLYIGYAPNLRIFGHITHQSDVPRIPIQIPNYSGLPKNQYQANIELSQSLFNRHIFSQDKIQDSALKSQSASLKVQLYNLQEIIINSYFGALLAQKQLEQNIIFEAQLQNNLALNKTRLENGSAQQSDLDLIALEILKIKKK